jgi:hypothetical protein
MFYGKNLAVMFSCYFDHTSVWALGIRSAVSGSGAFSPLGVRLAKWREQRYQESSANPSPLMQRLRSLKAQREQELLNLW